MYLFIWDSLYEKKVSSIPYYHFISYIIYIFSRFRFHFVEYLLLSEFTEVSVFVTVMILLSFFLVFNTCHFVL